MNKLVKGLLSTVLGMTMFLGVAVNVNAGKESKGFEEVYNLEIVKKVNEEKGLIELEDYVYLYEGDELVGIDYGIKKEGHHYKEGVFGVREGEPTKEEENKGYVDLKSKIRSKEELSTSNKKAKKTYRMIFGAFIVMLLVLTFLTVMLLVLTFLT